MFGIGMQELLVILLLVVVFFGSKRLPEIGAGLGKAIRNFRQGATEADEIDLSAKKTSAKMDNIEKKQSETVSSQAEKAEEHKG